MAQHSALRRKNQLSLNTFCELLQGILDIECACVRAPQPPSRCFYYYYYYFVCLFACLFVSLLVCFLVGLLVCLFVCMFVFMFVCMFVLGCKYLVLLLGM